jgi:hypothetical protein
MNLEERIAFHRHLATGYHEAYKYRKERGGVVYPEEWKLADDAVYFSPYFGSGEMGKFMKDAGQSMGDGANLEAIVYTAKFPDWGPVEFMCWPSDVGFSMRTKFEGTAENGTKMSFWACDFILTNEKGEVTRMETHVNGEDFGPVSELAVGVRGPFTDMYVYWEALHKRLVELGHG